MEWMIIFRLLIMNEIKEWIKCKYNGGFELSLVYLRVKDRSEAP